MTFFGGNNRECKQFIRGLLEKKYIQTVKKINYAHGYQQKGKKIEKSNEHCIIIESTDIDTCKQTIQSHKSCSLCITMS